MLQTLIDLKKINKKWRYDKQDIVKDELGRRNYTRYIFYLDTKKEPEYVINHIDGEIEIIDNVLAKTKNEQALLNMFERSISLGEKYETRSNRKQN